MDERLKPTPKQLDDLADIIDGEVGDERHRHMERCVWEYVARALLSHGEDGVMAPLRSAPRVQDAETKAANPAASPALETHKLDTEREVFFYEQDFYVLSNFSAFTLMWQVSLREGLQRFDTSEAVYHWEKFSPPIPTLEQRQIRGWIKAAPSAHEAFKIAGAHKDQRRKDWDAIKVNVMRDILRAKAAQHEYVRRKLLQTGDRTLIEDSWRDSFWGWGPNRDGQNMLGKLWMEVRAELRAKQGAVDAAEEQVRGVTAEPGPSPSPDTKEQT